MGRTPFRLVFQGKFIVEDNQTFLKGSFSMALSTKILTALWFGLVICFTIMPISGNQQELQPASLLLPVGATLTFLGLYGFGRWVSRNDGGFIVERIESSIKDDRNP
jgi:hypothetical protein